MKILKIFPLVLIGFIPPSYADNVAKCEVVLLEPVMHEGTDTGAEVASFRPADGFIASVYDEEVGNISEIDGFDIKGVMCERLDVVPTLRDFPIITTGLPFSISENFDSPDSSLMTVYYKDGKFKHIYQGADLSEDGQTRLDDLMEILNLQAHNLPTPDNNDE